MATSEKVKFCSVWGSKCPFTDGICNTCGENVRGKTSTDDNEKKNIRTFDDYMLLNSKKKKVSSLVDDNYKK